MNVIIMHNTIAMHDAIGNDIEMMYNILSKKNKCFAFAKNRFNKALEYIEEDELLRLMSDPETLLIYHHSVYWDEGERLIRQHRGRLIIRYHNITPPEFFKPYNDFHYEQCSLGREQTKRLAANFTNAFWLVDSFYNAEDIPNVPPERKGLCYPFNKIEKWAGGKPDEAILQRLMLDTRINLLFVSRVAPNKGHFLLLDILKCYCVSYDSNITLNIIGKSDDGLKGYNAEIKERVEAYGLQNNIKFIGEISDAILTSYYLGSDFFLCASDHEGFGVPLAEAQFFKLPVLAKNTSAIYETLGKNQLVFDGDARNYAAAIRIMRNNPAYCDYIKQKGRENFDNRFSIEKISGQFIKCLSKNFNVEF